MRCRDGNDSFSLDPLAEAEGLRAADPVLCKMELTEKAPLNVPENRAVLP